MFESHQVASQRIREVRAWLLDCVNAFWPASVAEELLVESGLGLTDSIPEAYLVRDLAYLAGRGLIECKSVDSTDTRAPARKIRRWLMTPKGVTFCERGKPWDHIEAF